MDQDLQYSERYINELPGIGPKTVQKFNSLGIFTLQDLLFHFPFRYEDVQAREVTTILEGEKVTLIGKVVTPPTVSYYGRNKNRLQFKLAVSESIVIQVVFFNQAYLAKNVGLGMTKAVYGKWQGDRQTLLGMRFLPMAEEGNDFQPIYHLTQGLKQSQVIKAIKAVFELEDILIHEDVPQYLNEKYRLLPIKQALYQMHFPKDAAERKQAERKIIYQEFFLYQWRLQTASHQKKMTKGIEIHYDVTDLKRSIQRLPFELTQGQKKAVNEICYDLLAPYPMQRMLQGDVGSGKTLVAFIAMVATVMAGYQAILMVPTEILATQHVIAFNELYEKDGLHAERLVSAMPNKEKQETINGLMTGRIRLVIGTHALIQENVEFYNLGLAVIDEQHRFGVGQRQALLSKGKANAKINLLQMTATPIPRTLALALYGEMGVSTIDELPKGRQPIETIYVKEDDIDRVYHQMAVELSKGHQIYYVLPIIEESETLTNLENVNSIYERLGEVFPQTNIGQLHGQLTKDDQKEVMELFVSNQLEILIATTMVEVGVNVPNATLMVIHSAERFGLAQLHQLRGRVGRGSAKSYCFLIGNPTTDQGKQRMEIMVHSQDGFFISQEDMKLRGHGDFLGRNQSGLPEFHYANLYQDQVILNTAREDVLEIQKTPYIIEEKEFKHLMSKISTIEIEI